ncbi:MAG: hypothetical protein ACREUN_03220 [Burkholderiales bacterium]
MPLAGLANPEERLVREYTRFAGSEANAESLVNGLRNDEQIRLSADGRTTTFTPPTRKLGHGNVDIALSLAKASLAENGVRDPTPEQIRAALNGGTITTRSGERVVLPGVLELRASGLGWGRIAQEHGFKLGEVMRHERHHGRADFHRARLERPERPHKPERPERPERHHHRR